MKNRFGTEIRKGMFVEANLAREGTTSGMVTEIDRRSDFAKAYGAQVKLDNGHTVGADDVRKVIAFYVTTFCNKAHRMRDGKPVAHECYVLPPAALRAERDGDMRRAIELIQAAPRVVSRGVKG